MDKLAEKTEKTDEILIRPAIPDDFALIKNSWLESYYRGNPDLFFVPKNIYENEQERIISKIVQRGGTNFLVVCDPEDTNLLFAWICWENDFLHYIYTKNGFRGFDFAAKLVKAANLNPYDLITTHICYYVARELVDGVQYDSKKREYITYIPTLQRFTRKSDAIKAVEKYRKDYNIKPFKFTLATNLR